MTADALLPTDFTAFFKAVWGYPPFPWQERLLLQLAKAEDQERLWPDVLDLPTGSGKTATLDIAVFHLALEAAKGCDRRAPVRIAFVVDRRLIVDDVYGRAAILARKLCNALDNPSAENPVVLKVARALRGLAGPDQPPLLARSLRGGMPLEHDWARTPVQPTILCSTVDQVGSRLLFRGYGVSDRMKPIHAGLLGSDCLILLDEAHLSEPFRQTLTAIENLRRPDTAPFGFSVLTATPAVEAKRPFGLNPDDHSNPILLSRIAAPKPARLVEIPGKQGMDTDVRRAEEITNQAKVLLKEIQDEMKLSDPAIGIVLNRVARARTVFEKLREDLVDAEVVLIIGPARAVDRDEQGERLEPIRTGRNDLRLKMSKPLVVVATQTIEAGVDIDFDGLVTEAAAFDALRQRFGRLNRAGRAIAAKAVVLAHREDIGSKADDPIYGDRIKTTWEALSQWAGSSGSIDFGIGATEEILKADPTRIANLVAPITDAPVLMPAYASLWSQTSPIPKADPDITLFLHGPNHSPASVQIIWRADIDRHDLQVALNSNEGRERLVELLALMPPRAAEAIQVPLWAARAWLSRSAVNQSNFSDTAEANTEANGGVPSGSGRPAFRWAGKDRENAETNKVDHHSKAIYPSELRNDDLIVVPAAYGGCDQWGWNPEWTADVIDVADIAAKPFVHRRFVLRIMPALVAQGLRLEGRVADPAFAAELAGELAPYEDTSRAKDIVSALAQLNLPTSMKSQLNALERTKRQIQLAFVYGRDEEERPGGVMLIAPKGVEPELLVGQPQDDTAALPVTEDDELSAMSDRAITIVDHCRDVREYAEGFISRAGLKKEEAAAVSLAAYLHDSGKADSRYQAYYAGGSSFGPDVTEPLAKTGLRRLPRDAWQKSGLPKPWRHEALSVRLTAIHPEFATVHDPELVLWLVGTHHGLGRPLFPHVDPLDASDAAARDSLLKPFGCERSLPGAPGPQSLAFDFNGSDWATMFEALKERYGIWGLARLEAFVRLADHRASETTAAPTRTPFKEAAE